MKEKRLFAAFLNFIFWGLGYFYLNKPVKGIITFTLYILVIVLSMTFMVFANPLLIFPVVFWIFLWSLWCSSFLAYDVYKTSEDKKLAPLKIKAVKKVKPRKRRSKKR